MLSFTHGTVPGLPGENEAKKESLVTKLKLSYVRGERENRGFVREVRDDSGGHSCGWRKPSLQQFFDSSSSALWVLSDACRCCFGCVKSSSVILISGEFKTHNEASLKAGNSDPLAERVDALLWVGAWRTLSILILILWVRISQTLKMVKPETHRGCTPMPLLFPGNVLPRVLKYQWFTV